MLAVFDTDGQGTMTYSNAIASASGRSEARDVRALDLECRQDQQRRSAECAIGKDGELSEF